MGTFIFHMHSSLGHFLSRISYERVVWTCKCLKDRCHGAQWNLHSVNDLRPLTLAKTWKLERNVITSKYFPTDHGCFIFQHWAWWLCDIGKGITFLVHTMELSRLRPSDRPTSDIYLIQRIWVISSEKSFGRFSKNDEKRDASRVNIEGEMNLHKDWTLAVVKTEDFSDN